MPNLYTNRNVFHLSKSVLVLKAFRYEGILSSGGHLPLTRSMSPQLVGHGHLAVSHANHPQLLGNGLPSIFEENVSSITRALKVFHDVKTYLDLYR